MSHPFVVWPAIDIRHGRVVRLTHGLDSEMRTYADDPVAVAASFAEAGARALHVVDLDAAFGDGDASAVIARIAGELGVRVQTGGGLRDDERVARMLGAGVARVVIGSAAVERPDWVGELVQRFGTDAIIVGIDARHGEVKTRGWVQGSGQSAEAVALQMAAVGVTEVVFTEIGRDGTLSGPDLEASRLLARATGLRVVVSGGVAGAGDIAACAAAAVDGIAGCVVGKALYEGRVSLAQALAAGAPRC
jgi:phosphoribosylformimino-5-aminoimidazole carboxamide ribotide isomerase